MANTDTQTLLNAVREAILQLLQGGAVASYELNGRQLAHYSLTQLMDLEKHLIRRLNAERPDNMTNYVRWENPK